MVLTSLSPVLVLFALSFTLIGLFSCGGMPLLAASAYNILGYGSVRGHISTLPGRPASRSGSA